MITFRSNAEHRLIEIKAAETGSWIEVRDPSKDELVILEKEYRILPEHLQDVLDIDEQARIEKEDEYTLIILRLPVYDPIYEVSYFTLPFGIFLFSDRVVTLCLRDCEVLEEIRAGRIRALDLKNKSAFVLHLLGRAAIVYLRYLKDINRRTTVIERELQRSVRNYELTQLLTLTKSLVFFTTSLKSNEILLEKLQTSRAMRFKEDETELLEDVLTDNKQAIEMANIYSSILAGMMDAFASVISNNLNIVMKRLTIISIVLMIPTFIVSMFGMNVKVPFEDSSEAFAIIAGICGASGLVGAILLRDRKPRPSKKLAGPALSSIVVRH